MINVLSGQYLRNNTNIIKSKIIYQLHNSILLTYDFFFKISLIFYHSLKLKEFLESLLRIWRDVEMVERSFPENRCPDLCYTCKNELLTKDGGKL